MHCPYIYPKRRAINQINLRTSFAKPTPRKPNKAIGITEASARFPFQAGPQHFHGNTGTYP